MILVNHQPQYLSSVQFFARMRAADVFVFADNVQFCKQDWQNRNRILFPSGVQWLVVPLLRGSKDLILDKAICWQKDFRRRHFEQMKAAYQTSPGWVHLSALLEVIQSTRWEKLVDVVRATTEWLVAFLEIGTRVLWASTLGLEEEEPNRRLAAQCRLLGCDTYMHGAGSAASYLDSSAFDGIRLVEHVWKPVDYPQESSPDCFVANLSIVDLIASRGADAKNYLGD